MFTYIVVKSEPRSCVKVEMAVQGSPSLMILTVSVNVQQHWNTASKPRSCVKVEAAVLVFVGRNARLNQ